MEKELTNVAAIRQYFSGGGKWGRKVEMQELKDLTMKDRVELGELAKIELAKEDN